MIMHFKDIPPLHRLIGDAGVPTDGATCGIRQPGELVGGFCQALFGARQEPSEHTRYVAETLRSIGVKYPTSHEIFFGHRKANAAVDVFLKEAAMPLSRDGCVPVLITGLEAGDEHISNIFATPAQQYEPVLVRMLVGEHSINAAAELLKRVMEKTRKEKSMPPWYPLFQGSNLGVEGWQQLAAECGEAWQYACVAINPFTSKDEIEVIKANVGVAQIPIGAADGINETIQLPLTMSITGAPSGGNYNLAAYLTQVHHLPQRPIFIVLGPTQPGWSDEDNRNRVARVVEVLNEYHVAL